MGERATMDRRQPRQWYYIQSGIHGTYCGQAQRLRRLGWSVGEPVLIKTEWLLPCCFPALEKEADHG